MENPSSSVPQSYAFVLKLSDHPGGMEIIAATFAHRGVSLACSLGNDGLLDPEGRATVLVTFSASPAKKENLRRALARLSRVRSLVEHPMDSPDLRKTAMFRLNGELTDLPTDLRVELVATGPVSGEQTYFAVARPGVVDNFLAALKRSGRLRDVTTTVIAL